MRSILIGGLAAFAIAGSLHAGTDAAAPLALDTTWTVSLDADGRVVELKQESRVKPLVAEPLERAIRGWSFEPGRVDGRPAATETTLNVAITLEPHGEGYAVRVKNARTGGGVARTTAPTFPRSALPSRGSDVFSALAVVEVRYDEAGKVIAADVAPGAPKVRRDVGKAALDSVRRWTFRPERVDGHAIAATVYVPLCFTASVDSRKAMNAQCEKWTPPGARAGIGGDGSGVGEAFALAPAATLKSEVVGRTL
jgi:TonB family protein